MAIGIRAFDMDLDLRFSQMAVFQAEADDEFGTPLLVRYDPAREAEVMALFPDARLDFAAQAFLYANGHDPQCFVKVRLRFDSPCAVRIRAGQTLRRLEGPAAPDDTAWCALRYANDRLWTAYYMHLELLESNLMELHLRPFEPRDVRMKDPPLHVFANDPDAALRSRRRRSSAR